jgi:hypothetical protein
VSISVTKLLPLISVQRRGEGTDGRARDKLDITVPTGKPVVSAISL